MQEFDIHVVELLKNGTAINEVARQLSISSKTVRDIRDKKISTEKISERGKGGKRKKDWLSVDKEMFPVVERTISTLGGKAEERPVRITVSGIARHLELPDKFFNNLPLCRKKIEEHCETQEAYWARELVWALQCIQKDSLPLNWKHIRNLTNMKKENAVRGLEHVKDMEQRRLLQQIIA